MCVTRSLLFYNIVIMSSKVIMYEQFIYTARYHNCSMLAAGFYYPTHKNMYQN
uniref:Uncharacterized protein n=1 Tax=Octopus bimaculoides TaxID=37653 RepID=A0A0L8IDZ3_OCTBM